MRLKRQPDFFDATPSAPRRIAPSCVNLLPNNRDGTLIDRSSIPCLDGCEIGFAGLVSRACAPAAGLEEIRRRGQRIGRNIEISANASRTPPLQRRWLS